MNQELVRDYNRLQRLYQGLQKYSHQQETQTRKDRKLIEKLRKENRDLFEQVTFLFLTHYLLEEQRQEQAKALHQASEQQ